MCEVEREDAAGRPDVTAGGAVSVEEAAAFTGLKRTSLYKLMTAGELPYTTVGRRRLVFRSGLVALLRRRAVVPAEAGG